MEIDFKVVKKGLQEWLLSDRACTYSGFCPASGQGCSAYEEMYCGMAKELRYPAACPITGDLCDRPWKRFSRPDKEKCQRLDCPGKNLDKLDMAIMAKLSNL